ncbi:hypothetical protein B0A48_01295 [Cryoendolithus antarcticus]|uniref:Uncharacterized protein n=1 Tax=Cryoendolithus antarcticus TaxID=1507870 RepID=A0A1V8TSV0_9PEZI|nr:hypothetical protein B0A48_01295 [Cryoendolithus antarcticus]
MPLPSITLTNPQNLDSAPSPVLSPNSPAKSPTKLTLTRTSVRNGASFELHRTGTWDRRADVKATDRIRSVERKGMEGGDMSDRRGSTGTRQGVVETGAKPRLSSPRRPSPAGHDGTTEKEETSVDPLSQQILERTHGAPPAPSIAPSMTSDGASITDDGRSQSFISSAQPSQERRDIGSLATRDLKKGVKAVSFLSRLIGTKKKDAIAEDVIPSDAASQVGSIRPEGAMASVFAQSTDNLSYSTRQPQMPAYIKMRARNKPKPEFNRLFLAQELSCSKKRKLIRTDSNKLRRKGLTMTPQDTVWAMEFSKDGNYLAAAGADTIIRVWKVLASPEDRQKHEAQEAEEPSSERKPWEHLKAPVFASKPIREFEGHSATVFDLSWSKNNFLLSSAMDKTVRLWHVSRQECLCTFKHNDIVPSVAFHPRDDRFFLAGSLDCRLRVWSIPDKSVAFSTQVPDMITAVAFTPDGKSVMAGCRNGLCMFYETEGLKYQTQLQVRPSRGTTPSGMKITGIQASPAANGDVKLLITSNDSRSRLYNMRDKSLELKFKGNVNDSTQIRAQLSDNGRYVVCGSEDGKAFVWSTDPSDGETREKRPVEFFEANEQMTTAVCMAPTKTRCLLGKSEDPIYDLCNPQPSTMLNSAGANGSQASSRPATATGDSSPMHAHDDSGFVRPKESASYLTKATHKQGNIIVTADFTGKIRVFRQDCAWQKRKPEDSDRASIFGSRRNVSGAQSSKAASITTRGSEASLANAGARKSSSSQVASSDRILSWRQGVGSSDPVTGEAKSSSKRTSRSTSPRRSMGQDSARSTPNLAMTSISPSQPTSAPSTAPTSLDVGERAAAAVKAAAPQPASPKQEKPPENPLLLGAGARSDLFWDMTRWKAQVARAKNVHSEADVAEDLVASRSNSVGGNGLLAVRPPLGSQPSFVSQLSDERSDETGDEDDEVYEEATEGSGR